MNKKIFENCNLDIRANIPVALFKNEKITPIDICLYVIIDNLSYKKGYCWCSNETLANALKVTGRTIQNRLLILEEEHFIKRIQTKDSMRQIYPIREIRSKIEIDNKEYEELFDYDWLNEEE